MITYRDMTFCSASTDGTCVNAKCMRFMNDERRAGANKWWKDVRSGDPDGHCGLSVEPPIAWSNYIDQCSIVIRPNEQD